MNYHSLLFSGALILTSALPGWADTPLTLAEGGKSTYSILVPKDAPPSVMAAAKELQRSIADASHVTLPIAHEANGESPVISLGDSTRARAAGVSIEGLVDEGFRIATRGRNLYIFGNDTREGEWTQLGGTSTGTANGVYTFLEEYVGVRWLMPGEIGRDVPDQPKLTLDPVERTGSSPFIWRLMSHIFDYARDERREKVADWSDRQKLGSSVRFEHNHNWDWLRQDPTIYQEHPEWFALINGKRKRPTNHYFKIETTNPELIQFFAEKAVSTLKADPRPNTFSLSPADSRGWSQSPESMAFYDPPYKSEGMDEVDPTEAQKRSEYPVMSSLILKWYHDVASQVAAQYPQGRLAGYLYGDYVWPPTKASMELPANFTPILCGPNYGFLLYNDVYVKRFLDVIEAWAKVAPDVWFYYDLPNQFWRQTLLSSDAGFPGGSAIVTPPGIGILDTIFKALVQNHIKGAYIYGESTWSNSALSNYLIAKLLWNPSLDVRKLQDEWLERAYGPKAGAVMIRFYDRLDTIFREYARTRAISGKLEAEYLEKLYAIHFNELEAIFLEASQEPMATLQKERLKLIEGNLVVLVWRLSQAGLLPEGFTSRLLRSDAEVAAVMEAEHPDFLLFPGVIPAVESRRTPRFSDFKAKRVRIGGGDASPAATSTVMPQKQHVFALRLERDETVRIDPIKVFHDQHFATYLVLERGSKQPVASGLLVAGKPIEFQGKARRDYLLYLPRRGPVAAELLVKGAVAADGRFDAQSETLYLEAKKGAGIYVYGHSDKVSQADNGVLLQAGTFSLNALKSEIGAVHELALDQGWQFTPAPSEAETQRPAADAQWKPIQVNDHWQNQGYSDYFGPAWYQIEFNISEPLPKGKAFLYFGAIDGNARVVLNQKEIGQRLLGENFSGWNDGIYFNVSGALKRKNSLLVRVDKPTPTYPSGMIGGATLVWEKTD